MGSFSVKLAVFLLLVTPCLGGLVNSVFGKLFPGKGGGQMTELAGNQLSRSHQSMPEPALVGNQLPEKGPYQLTGNNNPTYYKPINPSFDAIAASVAKRNELANKYFGGFKKGFRWGRKLHKRYLVVADTCEQFEQTLTSCNPVQNNYDPACVLHCIVVLKENLLDNKLVDSCTKYDDCDYPEEATCNLEQPATLNPTCYH